MFASLKNYTLKGIYSKLTLFSIIAFCTIKSLLFWTPAENWKMIVLMDGNGYYSYLPATFIHHDFSFKFYTERVKPEPVWFLVQSKGKQVNKYFIGEALVMTPFFLVSHGFSYLLEDEHNGYSKVYFIGVLIAALFYLWMGLFFLRKLLLHYQLNDLWISFILICFGIGSNLFYYSTQEPSMSHVYSFAFISLFLFLVQQYIHSKKRKVYFLSLFVLALIILIRPINGIILLFAPFFFTDFKSFRLEVVSLSKKVFREIGYYILVFSPFLLQLIVWKIETGYFVVESYPDERFYFDNPQIVNSLFSYNKGLFVYTPICFLSLFSFIAFVLQKKYFQLLVSFFFLSITVYFLSAWYQWQYGWSFGLRAYIDFFPVFALLIGMLLLSIRSFILKIIIVSIGGFTTFLNQFQTHQYIYKIIHPYVMDKEKYWKVFLDNSDSLQWIFYDIPKAPTVVSFTKEDSFSNDFEKSGLWAGDENLTNELTHSGSNACSVSSTNMYSPAFRDDLKRLSPNSTFEVNVEGYCFLKGGSNAHVAIMLANEKGESVNYQGKLLKEFGDDKWVQFNFMAQLNYTGVENLKVFITGTEGQAFADDIKVTLKY